MRDTTGVNTTALRTLGAIAFAIVLPFVCRWAVVYFEPSLAAAADTGMILWINAFLLAAFVLVLWTLTGRALLSLWVAFCLLWLLHALNRTKLEELERMLSPEDIALLGQVASNLDLFVGYVGFDLASLTSVAVLLLVTVFLGRMEPRTLPRMHLRLPLIVATAVLLGSITAGHSTWRERLTDDSLGGFQVWSPDRSMSRAGLVAGLVRLGWERTGSHASPSSSEQETLAGYVSSQRAELHKLASRPLPRELPDIILVQSEALFDPGRLRGLESRDYLPAFRALQERGMHGDLRVPTFGGGTIRTEFEVLTGYPLAAFPHVQYPYYGLTDRPLPNALPAQLRDVGYRTLLVHPYEADFWNRDSAMRRLGIDEMQFQYDHAFETAARRGPYISDEATFDAVLRLMREDKPQFVFVITMENHSPWRDRRNIPTAERDSIPVPRGLDAETQTALQSYLLHLRHGDAALGEFAEALLARPRPTLLLVYGDHLPSLRNVYQLIGFDDGRPAWEQPAPYALVANFPIETGRHDLDASALPSVVMEQAGLPLVGYHGIARHIRRSSRPCSPQVECTQLLHIAARSDIKP